MTGKTSVRDKSMGSDSWSDTCRTKRARSHAPRRHTRGSVARGEAQPTSDVDLLVDFERGRNLLDHGGLLMDLQETLDCQVDVVSARALRPRFREQVEKDAVAL